jgi:hypothetical protein
VHTQIRLADKQGLLAGPKISLIHFYCNVLLDIHQRLEKARRDDREIRLAFMASGTITDPAILFEEFADYEDDDTAEIDDGSDANGNPIVVRYDFSHAELKRTQAEVEAEIAEMLAAAASGTASFEQPQYDDWV